MMKLLLQTFREPQKDWYAKKGVSVHGCMFFFRCGTSSDIQIEIHDLFSNGDCTQNWFLSASALEASFKNFQSRHPEINVLSIWSDNGPHYHNTSLLLWLMRIHEICPVNIDKYSFFEAQKGKTALDAHFATFKFVLKAWMKRGNDIQVSDDITNGTKDHLKGTHVYEIQIDRTKEPPSAKTWTGITGYREFIYHYNNNACIQIEVKEQTNVPKSKLLKGEWLLKLWPSYICSASTSTGVTSTFDIEDSQTKVPRFQVKAAKQTKKCKQKTETTTPIAEDESLYTERKCRVCSKFFLRKGSLARHIRCKRCKTSEEPRKKHDAIEIALKKHATSIAAKTCHLEIQKVATQSEKGVCLYLNMYFTQFNLCALNCLKYF